MMNPDTEPVLIWKERDEQPHRIPVEAQLNRVDGGNYELSFEEGGFSGYPWMQLSREKLEKFYEKLRKELYPPKPCHSYKGKCGQTLEETFSGGKLHQCVFDKCPDERHQCRCGVQWETCYNIDTNTLSTYYHGVLRQELPEPEIRTPKDRR